MPMNFEDLDRARRQAALTALSDKPGKKRRNSAVARPMHQQDDEAADVVAVASSNNSVLGGVSSSIAGDESADLRTGRWTQEETDYCDALIRLFEEGKLPIPEGLKLNEFLANMLKSKQARLTKKMKNAKLATRQYKRQVGYIVSVDEARAFSRLETEFFASIKCPMERAEIRFCMQKEWRELFSSYCISIGHTLDANAWLSSVEELDQRLSIQKDAARMVRRKVMLGHALSYDASNSMQRGVYIDAAAASAKTNAVASNNVSADANWSQTSLISDASGNVDPNSARRELLHELAKNDHNPMKFYASPFIEQVMKLMKRLSVPFEHVDAWVPSFVSQDPLAPASGEEQQQKCRLCFAGCATADTKVEAEGCPPVPLGADEMFDLLSFGEYSEKFSFDIGCGLPGRVYSSGVASWEQGIQNAPLSQFERSGGASQWGIQTVLGIPIPSPSAGRIVILFYSTLDRPRNLALVNRIAEALSKVGSTPRHLFFVGLVLTDIHWFCRALVDS